MASKNSQKFIGRNRAPRVQIEYDLETYGSEKKVQLPFVAAVLADLSGKPHDPLKPLAERELVEIDMDNFDARLQAAKPRAAFNVENTLTGEGNISVDLEFESINDFSPSRVVQKVDALRKLYEARKALENLKTYMDGKADAEGIIAKLLEDKDLMQALAAQPSKPASEGEAPAQN